MVRTGATSQEDSSVLSNQLTYMIEPEFAAFLRVGASVPLRDIYDGLEFGSPDDTLWGRPC